MEWADGKCGSVVGGDSVSQVGDGGSLTTGRVQIYQMRDGQSFALTDVDAAAWREPGEGCPSVPFANVVFGASRVHYSATR